MMRSLRPAAHNIRSTLAISASKPSYAAGLRAAVSTIVPLIAAAAFGSTAGTWMSLGGFSASLADRGGSYRTRGGTMLALTASCAVAIFVGTVGGRSAVIVVALMFLVGLAASLARVWGNAGAAIGGSTLSTFVIAIAYPSTADDALARAAAVIAGGVWAMAVSLTLWPLRPYRPARVAVAAAWRSLADYIDEARNEIDHSLLAGTREYPAALPMVRTALENTRDVLARLRQGRAGATARGEQLIVIAQAADQIFGHVVGAVEAIEGIPQLERHPAIESSIIAQLEAMALTAREIADAIEREDPAPKIDIGWSGPAILARIELEQSDSAGSAVHYGQVAQIIDRASQYAHTAALTVARLEKKTADGEAAPAVVDDLEEIAPLRTHLRALLSPGSLLFRYALRVAVVTSAAVIIAESLHIKRGYWMTLTVIVILQPYAGITSQKAIQRVLGTVLGGILTAALGALIHDSWAIIALAFVLVTMCVAMLPVNYVAFSFFLTPTFVLLAEASAGDWHLAGTRVFNTIMGGALAWLGSRLLWPSPEASRLPRYMAASLRANRDYLNKVIERFGDVSDEAGREIMSARRKTGLAASNTDESFQRFLGEHSGRNEELAAAMTFMTYSRRLIGSIAALALARHSVDQTTVETATPVMREAAQTMDELAESLDTGGPPPPVPKLELDGAASPVARARVERIGRQLTTIHDALERWSSP